MSVGIAPAGKAGTKTIIASVNSAETSVSYNTNVALLIKLSQKHADPTKFLANRFTTTPNGMTKDEYFNVLDTVCVQCVATKPCSEIEIWEDVSLFMKKVHGSEVTLHVVRKRLFNLYLRHIISREKNNAQRYFLHHKWEARIRDVLK